MSIRSYRDLEVWQLAMKVAEDVFKLTTEFPKQQLYVLVPQIQRAVASIASNIAEGHSRHTTKEYIRFLNIASSSLSEVETQLILSSNLGYADKKKADLIMEELEILGKRINKLISVLKQKITNP